jgi:hypothetical protein
MIDRAVSRKPSTNSLTGSLQQPHVQPIGYKLVQGNAA